MADMTSGNKPTSVGMSESLPAATKPAPRETKDARNATKKLYVVIEAATLELGLGLSDEVSRAARTVECRIRDLIDTWSEA